MVQYFMRRTPFVFVADRRARLASTGDDRRQKTHRTNKMNSKQREIPSPAEGRAARRLAAFICAIAALYATSSVADDAIIWEGSTNLTMTANATVEVPAGTTNVIETLAGAYTLTKTGGGTLEIRYSKSANAKIVVSEGLVRFANPRPDDIFAKAYFHVDASDLSSMVMETVGGTNFVKRWNDTDGRAHWATNCTTVWQCRTNPENRLPFLRMNFQNGLPVMDFGSLLTKYNTNEVGEALGYGAAMKFDKVTPCIKEGFSVSSDTDDYDYWPTVPSFSTAMCGMSFFSHETKYCFARHDYAVQCRLGIMTDNSQNNNYFENGKSVWLDGVVLTKHPKNTTPSAGFHVYRIHPTADGNTVFNSFAAEYVTSTSRSYGGQRIAEYVLFTNTTETGESAMTTNEAEMVNRYLRVKWFPQTIAAVTVEKGASLDVDPSSSLTIRNLQISDAENVALGSSVVIDILNQPTTYVHFDASATNTMELVNENGTNFVTRWNDVNGRNLFATNLLTSMNNLTSVEFRPNPENRKAFVSENLTRTGLPVVDFGTIIDNTDTAETGGYGAAMFFGELKTAVMAEGFTVACDNEHLKERSKGVGGPSFFGGNDGDMYGRRGDTPGSNKTAPIYYYANSNGSSKYCSINGTSYLDGNPVVYSANYPDGFHVLNTIPSGKMPCNTLGRNYRNTGSKSNSYGGTRIGEFILLGTALSDETVRARMSAALMAKWLGSNRNVRCWNDLSVVNGASVAVKWENVAVTNKLTLAGSISAPALSAANMEVVGANATVSAPLTLSDGATLSFARGADGSWPMLSASSVAADGAVTVVLAAANLKGLAGTEARLVAADTPPASLDDWSVSFVSSGATARLALRADGIYVEFAGKGTAVIVR